MYEALDTEYLPRRNSQILQQHQLALEYAHAVWSSEPGLPAENTHLNENEAAKLLEAFERLSKTTMLYCMASSAASRDPERPSLADMQFHAKSSRSEEHTSELQSLMRISYAVFCLKKKKN